MYKKRKKKYQEPYLLSGVAGIDECNNYTEDLVGSGMCEGLHNALLLVCEKANSNLAGITIQPLKKNKFLVKSNGKQYILRKLT